ncbi:hypothetical protein JQU17_08505 [Ponticoccus sp. SC2-23]|uniref:hypothetical protein n=1 Tax=Alexandriicola marinus TaxID=2081710 RepID=UPI000FD80934|nr:hypothetical protein [Alexandriicola marinus]MBM1220273.1 hypothetical protein [Ponticoccus sp. SC6-9]MBM1224959.1 hypothetical protein [Ponticoccus sp. SC6-15]MBM1228473.1 hypothetical protein [Ponticoccus sp. SC6-38]MBM1233890.1 hypothetical protein [Ponticoccus sp. SC6-45]MBM1238974.1 hypothetical protein [Ponticoccus sp. SC6-49]MBM1242756.1 hypothetical protein [Ponticoccus sp. SC2-64]MBM1247414.1 hypothetical protein [Ponticoccus sp. SC6-42]MBM1251927.1 hypothetical protein [Pontico
MTRQKLILAALLVLAPPVAAQDADWERADDVTTAVLAEDGAELLSSSSFVDGRDYISITYWMRGTLRRNMYRCVDRVSSDGVSRRSRCARVTS